MKNYYYKKIDAKIRLLYGLILIALIILGVLYAVMLSKKVYEAASYVLNSNEKEAIICFISSQ